MARTLSKATEFAADKGISIANASMKFKQLWERGFLLRREATADTGGIEFVYQRIG
jgi:predicted transcriptional regulator